MASEVKELKSGNPNQIARTLVGREVVSTIYLDSEIVKIDNALSTIGDLMGISYEDIGASDLRTPGFYETMVFPCDEEGDPTDWGEVDFARYDSEEEAKKGHEAMVEKRKDLNG